MLNLNEKTSFLENYLNLKNESYSDLIKDEIYFHVFENNIDLKFLNTLHSKNDIENKIDLIISKIILHEHQSGISTIINEYL
jgi:hypothetical protein